jgi:hypothetical protein
MARSEWAVGYLTKDGLLVLAGQLPPIEQLGRGQLMVRGAGPARPCTADATGR